MNSRNLLALLVLLLIPILTSCLPFFTPAQETEAIGIEQTLAALSARETVFAISQLTPLVADTVAPPPPENTPTSAPPASATAPPTATWTLSPTTTSTTIPTNTFTPTITSTITTTPTLSDVEKTQVFESRLKSANILIYEDVIGVSDLMPRIDGAIRGLRIEEEHVVNTYDAPGKFLSYLDSDTPWDLVIISLENRETSNHGIIGSVLPHVDQKGALIVEAWNLDEMAGGNTSFLLDDCGVKLQQDWYRPKPHDLVDYFLSGFNTGNPILHTPNIVNLPLSPSLYWEGDAGDLLMLSPGSDAQLLAGIYSEDLSRYGLVASCIEGRVILQTFSSHDYRLHDTTRLMQNYITHTLTNHFQVLDE